LTTTSVVAVTMWETADVDLCADDTREPEPELLKGAMIEELEGYLVVGAVDLVPGELLPEPAELIDVVGMAELEVLKELNEFNPVEELGKEELDGGAEVDGNMELLELGAVAFPPGPQGPVTIKLALTPPVVPELVTVMSSQKSGKTIS
jgi:hypothetical protein